MGQYDFSYEFPEDFENWVIQLLQQDNSGQSISRAFHSCEFEYEDLGLAFYAGLKAGDNWNKHALDFTFIGNQQDISLLKNNKLLLKNVMAKALRPGTTGFLVKDIDFLVNDKSPLPASNEARINADIVAANTFLDSIIKIAERISSNATYKKDSSENSINDYFRDALSLMGYSEVKDQTRHGLSASGKAAGEVDLLICKDGKEIAIFEGLKLSSIQSDYIDTHIAKAIVNYNALGTATFIVAYVSAHDFDSFWTKYVEHIGQYRFPLLIKKDLKIDTPPNAAIRIADLILSRDGFDFPVYFVALRIY